MSDYLRCWRRKPLVQFDWRPYEKEKFGPTHRHVIMKAEMGGCGRDQGIPKLAGTPPEARGRAWNAFPLGLRRSQPCCHFGPGVRSPELRDVTFLLSKPPVCGALPRPPWAAHTLGEADTVHGQTCRPVWGVRPGDGRQLSALRAQPQPQTAALPEAAPSPGKLASHI